MNLDEKITKMGIEAMMISSLDINWQDDALDINCIYADIMCESVKLKTEGKSNVALFRNDVLIDMAEVSRMNRLLKKLDDKLQGCTLYRNGIRKLMKKVYKGQLLQPAVYVRNLIKYNDREFVNVCYHTLLKRNADIIGLRNHLRNLRMHEISKIEFIYALSNSEEGMRQGIIVKGGRFRLLFAKCLRKSYGVPILGKGFRWFHNRITMNKRLYDITLWNMDITAQQNELLQRLETLEQENWELRRQLGK